MLKVWEKGVFGRGPPELKIKNLKERASFRNKF
jgi:hypothetical protein